MIIINDNNINVLKQAIKNNQPLDDFDTRKVNDMCEMFKGATSFNQPLYHFDTSNVNCMAYMFLNATSMSIGYIMRFATKVIFVYKKYKTMKIKDCYFSKSIELDDYIIHLHNIKPVKKNKAKIDRVLDGFIVG